MNQEQTEKPATGPKPEQPFVLPPTRPVKGTSLKVAGCGRWATYGCLGGVVLLAGFLFTSFFTIKKGLVWTAVRGCRQVERKLPADMEPVERARVMNNFDRVVAELRRTDDPNPVLGRYLGLVAGVLEDDVVTLDEVEEINAFIETEFPETPPPPEAEAPRPPPTAGAENEPASSG